MATLRELRDRIRSVNSTKKITKAQEMIATSRINKALARVEEAQPYADEMQEVMERLASATTLEHPMLQPRENVKTAAVLVITSDRGMCGGYNYNVLKRANELEKLLEEKGYEVKRYVAGGKGVDFYQFRGVDIAGQWTGFSQDPSMEATHDMRQHLIEGFQASSEGTAPHRDGVNVAEDEDLFGFDSVHVVHTEFESMLVQEVNVHQLLPIEPVYQDEEVIDEDFSTTHGDTEARVECEPDPEALLESLLPKYVSRILYAMLLEASAAESAARRTAMKAATDNATDLVNDLSRVANQARQAQITQEINEIVGGAGALAGSGESD